MSIENGETGLSVRTELNAALALVATAVQPADLASGTITPATGALDLDALASSLGNIAAALDAINGV